MAVDFGFDWIAAAWMTLGYVVLEGNARTPGFSTFSLMNKVDKDTELGAGKQGPRGSVSWLSSFTAWDLRQARGELSRWIGPRPWQVPSTDSTIVPVPDLEVSSTSSTIHPQWWICPLRIYK